MGSQNVEARGSPFGLFAFPQTRRGRATKTLLTSDANGNKVLTLGENNSDDPASAILDVASDKMVMKNEHNHSERIMEAKVKNLKQNIYNAASQLNNKTLFEIFLSETEKIPKDLAEKVTYKEVEPGMRKRREKLFQTFPKTLDEVNGHLEHRGPVRAGVTPIKFQKDPLAYMDCL